MISSQLNVANFIWHQKLTDPLINDQNLNSPLIVTALLGPLIPSIFAFNVKIFSDWRAQKHCSDFCKSCTFIRIRNDSCTWLLSWYFYITGFRYIKATIHELDEAVTVPQSKRQHTNSKTARPRFGTSSAPRSLFLQTAAYCHSPWNIHQIITFIKYMTVIFPSNCFIMSPPWCSPEIIPSLFENIGKYA